MRGFVALEQFTESPALCPRLALVAYADRVSLLNSLLNSFLIHLMIIIHLMIHLLNHQNSLTLGSAGERHPGG